MNQLNDVSFMQMVFQIFKITIHLSSLSTTNFFVIFHWKLCTCEVALFEKLEFNEKVLNLKLVVFLKAITEANIICFINFVSHFCKSLLFCNDAVFFFFMHIF